jgi:hypothetical protein
MRWLRYLMYVALFGVWLALMFFPCLAFSLAMQQEIQAGGSDGAHVRLFLLQEAEKEGVGIEWQRPLPLTDGCYKTAVTYVMWAGEGENITYCACPPTSYSTLSSEEIRACTFP